MMTSRFLGVQEGSSMKNMIRVGAKKVLLHR